MPEVAMSAIAATREMARGKMAFLGVLLAMMLSPPGAASAADAAPTPQQFDVTYDNYTLRDGHQGQGLRAELHRR
jgi:hypothetical protein